MKTREEKQLLDPSPFYLDPHQKLIGSLPARDSTCIQGFGFIQSLCNPADKPTNPQTNGQSEAIRTKMFSDSVAPHTRTRTPSSTLTFINLCSANYQTNVTRSPRQR